MLLEKLPEVQSLTPEDKWRLIDELWSDLARQVEGAGPDTNIVEILEKRFSNYLADPGEERRKFSHDWRNVSASGNNLSSRGGADLLSAWVRYEEALTGLGERFETEVQAALLRIGESRIGAYLC